jgi:uncharacterized protein with PIN domain
MKCTNCENDMVLVSREEQYSTGSFNKFYICVKCESVEVIYSNRRKATEKEKIKTLNNYAGVIE